MRGPNLELRLARVLKPVPLEVLLCNVLDAVRIQDVNPTSIVTECKAEFCGARAVICLLNHAHAQRREIQFCVSECLAGVTDDVHKKQLFVCRRQANAVCAPRFPHTLHARDER